MSGSVATVGLRWDGANATGDFSQAGNYTPGVGDLVILLTTDNLDSDSTRPIASATHLRKIISVDGSIITIDRQVGQTGEYALILMDYDDVISRIPGSTSNIDRPWAVENFHIVGPGKVTSNTGTPFETSCCLRSTIQNIESSGWSAIYGNTVRECVFSNMWGTYNRTVVELALGHENIIMENFMYRYVDGGTDIPGFTDLGLIQAGERGEGTIYQNMVLTGDWDGSHVTNFSSKDVLVDNVKINVAATARLLNFGSSAGSARNGHMTFRNLDIGSSSELTGRLLENSSAVENLRIENVILRGTTQTDRPLAIVAGTKGSIDGLQFTDALGKPYLASSNVSVANLISDGDLEGGSLISAVRQTTKIIIQTEGLNIVARSMGEIVHTDVVGELPAVLASVVANDLTSGRTWKETIRIVGDYEIDTPILPASYTRIELDGSIKVADGTAYADAYLIYMTAITNAEIVGGYWDSNGSNHSGDDGGDPAWKQFGVMVSDGCEDITFQDMHVDNAGRDGFLFNGLVTQPTRIRCINCLATNAADDGFNPLACNHIEFIGCVARDNVFDGFHMSVGSSDITIIGGISEDNSDYAMTVYTDRISIFGMQLNGPVLIPGASGDVLMQGNRIDVSDGGQGIRATAGTNDARIVIDGNYVSNMSLGTVSAMHISRDRTRIINNTIYSTGTDQGEYGIKLDAADGCDISGNFIDAALRLDGITLVTCVDTVLRDNHVINTTRNSLNIYNAGTTGTRLSGNRFDATGTGTDIVDSGTGTLQSTYAAYV